MINKKLDHDINGFKVIEKKDYIKNEEYKIYDCLTEWS